MITLIGNASSRCISDSVLLCIDTSCTYQKRTCCSCYTILRLHLIYTFPIHNCCRVVFVLCFFWGSFCKKNITEELLTMTGNGARICRGHLFYLCRFYICNILTDNGYYVNICVQVFPYISSHDKLLRCIVCAGSTKP